MALLIGGFVTPSFTPKASASGGWHYYQNESSIWKYRTVSTSTTKTDQHLKWAKETPSPFNSRDWSSINIQPQTVTVNVDSPLRKLPIGVSFPLTVSSYGNGAMKPNQKYGKYFRVSLKARVKTTVMEYQQYNRYTGLKLGPVVKVTFKQVVDKPRPVIVYNNDINKLR